VHRVPLHEMGHALGLSGHSPLDTDIMGGRREKTSRA
jgi:predicted Zn-dependent protease